MRLSGTAPVRVSRRSLTFGFAFSPFLFLTFTPFTTPFPSLLLLTLVSLIFPSSLRSDIGARVILFPTTILKTESFLIVPSFFSLHSVRHPPPPQSLRDFLTVFRLVLFSARFSSTDSVPVLSLSQLSEQDSSCHQVLACGS